VKKERTLLLIALFAAGQVVAQQRVADTPVSRTPTSVEQKFYQLVPVKTVETKEDLNRFGGLDTRAWTTVAGWSPGKSAFPDAENYTWQLNLLSVGHQPQPWQ